MVLISMFNYILPAEYAYYRGGKLFTVLQSMLTIGNGGLYTPLQSMHTIGVAETCPIEWVKYFDTIFIS